MTRSTTAHAAAGDRPPPDGPHADDPFAAVRQVADAVLYEGYVLYPYRADAAKNRDRWQFGVLVPPSASRDAEATIGPGGSAARLECLVEGSGAEVRVLVRFLHVQARVVELAGSGDPPFVPVASAVVGGRVWTSWDEAIEHEIDVGWVAVGALARSSVEVPVSLIAGEEVEGLVEEDGTVVGRVVRRRRPVTGAVRVGASGCDPPCPLRRIRVDVENRTPWNEPVTGWDETTRHAIVAAHVLVAARGGRFVSLMDPPEFAREAAAARDNRGLYPVLAGPAPSDGIVLAAPIILYDHPQLAPESDGDYFDATEIDELLTLRVLTLTDEEKAQARRTDPRAAAIIDRCDRMPDDVFGRLHGAIRSLRPVAGPVGGLGASDGGQGPAWGPGVDAGFDPRTDCVVVDGAVVGAGSKVRLEPSRRADAQDMFVSGLLATVTGVYNDVDGGVHVAVVIDEDPAAGLHECYGRYRYYRPDEVVAVAGPDSS